MTDHLHITTDSNDQISGVKTFSTAPIVSGSTPSITFLDTLLDPTMLTLRKISGDIELYDELSSSVLIKLLSTVDASDIGLSNTTGSNNTYSLADHKHQGIHSLMLGTPMFGDATLSEGTDIVLTQVGNTITIDSTGVPGSLLALGILPAANGGTGLGNYTVGDLIVATASNVLGRLADAAQGNLLLSGGIGAIPSYGKANLSNHTIGTLPLGAITPGIVGQALLTLTGGIVGWGMLDLANTAGTLALANLQDDPVADKVLLAGGPGADPHWGTLDITSLTGTISLAQIPDGSIAGQCLIGQGVGADPIWGPVGINTGLGGLLTIAKGGTFINNLTGYINGRWAYSSGAVIGQAGWSDGNGATLIGATGSLPQGRVLTAGTGIAITNAANSITIARSGGSGDPDNSNTSCYLVYDAPNIALKPDEGKGSFLDIGGIPRYIPYR